MGVDCFRIIQNKQKMQYKSLVKLVHTSEIDMEIISSNSGFFDMADLSRHPRLRKEHIETYPDLLWNWCEITKRFPEIDVVGILMGQRDARRNPDKPVRKGLSKTLKLSPETGSH